MTFKPVSVVVAAMRLTIVLWLTRGLPLLVAREVWLRSPPTSGVRLRPDGCDRLLAVAGERN